MTSKEKKGKLYIVSTPIGNKDDFTLRAIKVLKISDFVVCEELKMGAAILRQINLNKDLLTLNEHNEFENVPELITLLKDGNKLSLISDAGTPLFADPGKVLVRNAISQGIEIEVVPGASSIMTAIVRSGFNLNEFLYAGFLSRETDARLQKIKELSYERRTVVLLETPYRLLTLLEVLSQVMPERSAYIGMNLTMHYETHHYGTFAQLYEKLKEEKTKSEFVICFEGNFSSQQRPRPEKREFTEQRHEIRKRDPEPPAYKRKYDDDKSRREHREKSYTDSSKSRKKFDSDNESKPSREYREKSYTDSSKSRKKFDSDSKDKASAKYGKSSDKTTRSARGKFEESVKSKYSKKVGIKGERRVRKY